MSKGNPLTPYAGTSGHRGSVTSRDRALHEDGSGITADRQRLVYRELHALGSYGATVREVRQTYGWHHGQASSVLSVLHKEGLLARLVEVRSRCAVYVHPEFVNGRETIPHVSDRPCTRPDCVTHRNALDLLHDTVARWLAHPDTDREQAMTSLMGKIKRDVLDD